MEEEGVESIHELEMQRFRSGFQETPLHDLLHQWESVELDFDFEHGVVVSGEALNFILYGGTVALHAVLEEYLRAVCDLVQRHRKMRIGVADLHGKGVARKARDYLSKVHMIDLPDQRWDALDDFVIVRNCIAHESGYVSGQRDKKRLTARNDMTMTNGRLLLTQSFIDRFEDVIHERCIGESRRRACA